MRGVVLCLVCIFILSFSAFAADEEFGGVWYFDLEKLLEQRPDLCEGHDFEDTVPGIRIDLDKMQMGIVLSDRPEKVKRREAFTIAARRRDSIDLQNEGGRLERLEKTGWNRAVLVELDENRTPKKEGETLHLRRDAVNPCPPKRLPPATWRGRMGMEELPAPH